MKQVPVERPSSAAGQGETTPARQDDLRPEDKPGEDTPSPHLPHEHDESSHSQASASPQHRPVGEKAYEDTTSDRVDTDKGPVMDDVYHRMVTEKGGESRRK